MKTGKIIYRAEDFGDDAVSRRKRAASSVCTVDELTSSIKDVIVASPVLRNISVRGELQNFKRHSSGHVYFSLLGADARIAGVMFRSSASGMITWPSDGDEVVITGSVDVYAKSGTYQIYATRMLPVGLGAQTRAREELRLALEKEGLFDPRHKKRLPKYPAKVAVITSPTGAAIQDILKISSNRAPFVDIVLIPAVVQGVDAPQQVARALAQAGTLRDVECVIVARGGGAKDDLSPFDDERIVRAIASCPLPVVTGVGHQTDSFLSDLAADVALPTPSAAAERVFPQKSEIVLLLDSGKDTMRAAVLRTRERAQEELAQYTERLSRCILYELQERENYLKDSMRTIEKSVRRQIERNEDLLASAASRLNALSPLAVLARGYALCTDEAGAIVSGVDRVKPGDVISVRFRDGKAIAEVLKTSATQ